MTLTKCYAASRWADAVVRTLDAPEDPRTVPVWGHAIGASEGTLRNWCRTARLSAKRSLDLARLLRALYLSQSRPWVPEQLLDTVDQRTLYRLLARGGINGIPRPTIQTFLREQRLIANLYALEELQKALTARNILLL